MGLKSRLPLYHSPAIADNTFCLAAFFTDTPLFTQKYQVFSAPVCFYTLYWWLKELVRSLSICKTLEAAFTIYICNAAALHRECHKIGLYNALPKVSYISVCRKVTSQEKNISLSREKNKQVKTIEKEERKIEILRKINQINHRV